MLFISELRCAFLLIPAGNLNSQTGNLILSYIKDPEVVVHFFYIKHSSTSPSLYAYRSYLAYRIMDY